MPKLGQVFLKDKKIIQKILDAAQIQKEESILEVGCGAGILTKALSEQTNKLNVVELDLYWLNKTKLEVPTARFIHDDILNINPIALESHLIRIIANIPYYLSAKFMKWIIQYRNNISDAIIMVQKEFAEKLTAKPSHNLYTSLSVHTNFYLDISYLFTVSKHCFLPVPKVDSAVIQIKPKALLPVIVDEDLFFNIVRSAFWGRRKPLKSALNKSPYMKGINVSGIPDYLGNLRGETLSLSDFYCVYQIIKEVFPKSNEITSQ
jgi:16S rRNA (adenine1518-N6/adenine1519-N6)-dimethyltransferase